MGKSRDSKPFYPFPVPGNILAGKHGNTNPVYCVNDSGKRENVKTTCAGNMWYVHLNKLENASRRNEHVFTECDM